MTEAQASELRADFPEWSGGFLPESEYQITVYIDYALSKMLDEVEVRHALCAWMNTIS